MNVQDSKRRARDKSEWKLTVCVGVGRDNPCEGMNPKYETISKGNVGIILIDGYLYFRRSG